MTEEYEGHKIEEMEEGRKTVHRCVSCGLIYKTKSSFKIHRCTESRISLEKEEE